MQVSERKWPRWRGPVVWGVVLAAVVYAQWPMLKGTYYKRAGAPAPPAAVEWRNDFSAASDEARRTGKPVHVAFGAAWCPPCVAMKHDVWPDPDVGRAVNAGYVPVFVDVDDPRARPVAERYEVEGIPAVIVVDPDGRVVRRAAYTSKGAALSFLAGA
jgi:uncharacterized protein YyaL (SSP411 family)